MSKLFESFDADRPEGVEPPIDPSCVRRATPDDIEHVIAISRERQEHIPDDTHERILREVEGMHAGKSCLLLVAELDGEIVGFGRARYLTPEDDDAGDLPEGWFLTGVIVRPHVRRRGVGRALTRARLTWIREHADEAWYFCNQKNDVSIALHDPFGFEYVRPVAHARAELTRETGRLFRARLR